MIKFTDALTYYFNVFKRDLELKKGYVSEKTIQSYSYTLNNLLKYLEQKRKPVYINKITENNIKDFLITCLRNKSKPVTLNRYMYTFRSFWKVISKEYNIKNITLNLEKSNTKRQESIHFSENHIDLFKKHLDKEPIQRNKIFFKIVIKYGCRISEAIKLQKKDIEITNKSINITFNGKGNKERQIPLPINNLEQKEFEKELINFLNTIEKGHLFISKHNKIWHENTIRQLFKKYMKELDLTQYKYKIHSLRHAAASYLLNKGIGLPAVSEILGHANSSITATVYAHANKEDIYNAMGKMY